MKFVFLTLFLPFCLCISLSLPLLLPDTNHDGFSDIKDFFSIINPLSSSSSTPSSSSSTSPSFSLDEKSYFSSNLMTKSDLLEIFLLSDTDSDGLISRAEWSVFYKTFFQMFSICDKNQNSKLNFNEISCLMEKEETRKREEKEREDGSGGRREGEEEKKQKEQVEKDEERRREGEGREKGVKRGDESRKRERELKEVDWKMDIVKMMGLLKLGELNFIDYLFLKRFEYGWSKFQKGGSLGKYDFKLFLVITQYFYEFENDETESFFYLMIKYGRKSLEEQGGKVEWAGGIGREEEGGRREDENEEERRGEKEGGKKEEERRVGLTRVAYFLLGYNDYLKMQVFIDRKAIDLDDLEGKEPRLFNQNYMKNNPFINDTIYSFGRLTFSDFFILNEIDDSVRIKVMNLNNFLEYYEKELPNAIKNLLDSCLLEDEETEKLLKRFFIIYDENKNGELETLEIFSLYRIFNLFMQLDGSQKFVISNLIVNEYLKKNEKKLKETFFLPLKPIELRKIKELSDLKNKTSLNFLLFSIFMNFENICQIEPDSTISLKNLEKCLKSLGLTFLIESLNEFEINREITNDRIFDYESVKEEIFIYNSKLNQKNIA